MKKSIAGRGRSFAAGFAACVLLCAGVLFVLLWNGVLQLNNPSRAEYPVRGVDLSAYQGEVDWAVLADQALSFAFIKATEGSTFVDARFAENYAAAQTTGLRIGAYHFFSFESGGDTQADNFIATVEPHAGMLPPVIDLEFYGEYEKNPPPVEAVRAQLDILLERLEARYGMRPILYATEASYARYLAGGYADTDIWIRNVLRAPRLSDGRAWTFWQYTNRKRLEGYRGVERFIDVNLFNGTSAEFERYAAAG